MWGGGGNRSREFRPRGCKQMQGETLIIGSMDVKSLYPSCKSKGIGEHIVGFFGETGLTFEGVNLKAVVRYLSLTGFKGPSDLEDYIPRAKGTTTLNSWLTTESPDQFYDPVKEICLAEDKVVNQLLGHVVARATDAAIKNHFYTLGGSYIGRRTGLQWGWTCQ